MEIIQFVIYGYLGIGFVYALYILLFQGDHWYAFPINLALGPVFLVYNFVALYKERKHREI